MFKIVAMALFYIRPPLPAAYQPHVTSVPDPQYIHTCLFVWQVGVRVFHEEDVDTGLSFLKLNEVGPATTETVDNEIKRLLQVNCIVSILIFSKILFVIFVQWYYAKYSIKLLL